MEQLLTICWLKSCSGEGIKGGVDRCLICMGVTLCMLSCFYDFCFAWKEHHFLLVLLQNPRRAYSMSCELLIMLESKYLVGTLL